MGWPQQIDRILVPQLHLGDAPGSSECAELCSTPHQLKLLWRRTKTADFSVGTFSATGRGSTSGGTEEPTGAFPRRRSGHCVVAFVMGSSGGCSGGSSPLKPTSSTASCTGSSDPGVSAGSSTEAIPGTGSTIRA